MQLRIDTFQRDQRPLFLVLARDLTEPKRLEEQFLQSQKVGSMGRFAGSVAHDFGNMLTPILSYSELIARALPENQTRLHSYSREVIRPVTAPQTLATSSSLSAATGHRAKGDQP